MDFVLGLLRSSGGNYIIWIIIDWMTKPNLFLPMKMIDLVDKLAKLYIDEVVILHD